MEKVDDQNWILKNNNNKIKKIKKILFLLLFCLFYYGITSLIFYVYDTLKLS